MWIINKTVNTSLNLHLVLHFNPKCDKCVANDIHQLVTDLFYDGH